MCRDVKRDKLTTARAKKLVCDYQNINAIREYSYKNFFGKYVAVIRAVLLDKPCFSASDSCNVPI